MCDANMDARTDYVSRIYSSKDASLQLDCINTDRSDLK